MAANGPQMERHPRLAISANVPSGTAKNIGERRDGAEQMKIFCRQRDGNPSTPRTKARSKRANFQRQAKQARFF